MNLPKVRSVSEVMETEVVYISPTVSVFHVSQMMAEKKVSFVVVAEEESEKAVFPIGIITERDIEQIQASKLDLANIEAKTVMSAPLLCVNLNDSLLHARLLMLRKYLHQLVVVGDAGELVGVVSLPSCLPAGNSVKKKHKFVRLGARIRSKNNSINAINQIKSARNKPRSIFSKYY